MGQHPMQLEGQWIISPRSSGSFVTSLLHCINGLGCKPTRLASTRSRPLSHGVTTRESRSVTNNRSISSFWLEVAETWWPEPVSQTVEISHNSVNLQRRAVPAGNTSLGTLKIHSFRLRAPDETG